MDQWEYKKLNENSEPLDQRLAAAGLEGWEAYAVTGDTAELPTSIWLKRRKTNVATLFANMSPSRAAYVAFCQKLPMGFDVSKPMADAECEKIFAAVAKAAIEANNWLRLYKPTEAYDDREPYSFHV